LSLQVIGLLMILLSIVKYNITTHSPGILSFFQVAGGACNVNAYEALGPLVTFACSTVNVILMPAGFIFLLGLFFLFLPTGVHRGRAAIVARVRR
jgi:hypothetical protein